MFAHLITLDLYLFFPNYLKSHTPKILLEYISCLASVLINSSEYYLADLALTTFLKMESCILGMQCTVNGNKLCSMVGIIWCLILKSGLSRLSQTPTRLRNTVGSMIGCARKEKIKELSGRGNVAVLKLRFLNLLDIA